MPQPMAANTLDLEHCARTCSTLAGLVTPDDLPTLAELVRAESCSGIGHEQIHNSVILSSPCPPLRTFARRSCTKSRRAVLPRPQKQPSRNPRAYVACRRPLPQTHSTCRAPKATIQPLKDCSRGILRLGYSLWTKTCFG